MNKWSRYITLFVVALVFSLAEPSTASAQTVNCYGKNTVYSQTEGGCIKNPITTNADENIGGIQKYFNGFAYAITYIASGASLLLIILSGFQYTLSEGDNFKIEEAKNTLLRAGIGMLVAFSSFSILELVNVFENFQ